jgi:hypothetical protein
MKALCNFSLLITFTFGLFLLQSCNINKNISNKGEYYTPQLNLSHKVANEKYISIVDSAMTNPISIDYETLRMTFACTKDFKPYGDDQYLKKIKELLENNEYEVATEVVKEVITELFYDPLFHFYAYVAWNQSGNEELSDIHSYYYVKLLESILKGGDGKSPRTAFHVISVAEEYRVMEYLEVELNTQSLINVDGHTFDLMEVKDSIGTKSEIYFNIDIPFNSLPF